MGNGADAKRMAKSALERIKELEDNVQTLFQALQGVMQNIEDRFSLNEELLAALKNVVGVGIVDEAIKAIRREAGQKELDGAIAALDGALAAGQMVPATKIDDLSVLVVYETNPDGTPTGLLSGRSHLRFSALPAELRDQLRGKEAGATLPNKDGGQFRVAEIYDFVPTGPANTSGYVSEAS